LYHCVKVAQILSYVEGYGFAPDAPDVCALASAAELIHPASARTVTARLSRGSVVAYR
jgi:hypothetical protein